MQEREYLVGNITKLTSLTDLRNLDRAISLNLEKYELVSVFCTLFAIDFVCVCVCDKIKQFSNEDASK